MFSGLEKPLRAIALLAFAGAFCLELGLRPTLTTFDRNDDGRADVWEYHDGPFGTLSKIVEDTNFDGRQDRVSYVVAGSLRRETDTNFDGRVDQVEEFDVDSNRTRTVRDTDHDGTADVLVLYQDGVPIYTQRAGAVARPATLSSQHGHSFIDPFEGETTVRREVRGDDSLAGLSSRAKLYLLAPSRASPARATPVRVFTVLNSSSHFDPRPLFPRGPPASDSTLL